MPFTPPPRPARAPLVGHYCTLEPLAPAHAPALFEAFSRDTGQMWDYMPNGPFETLNAYRAWLDGAIAVDDPLQFAVVVDGTPQGSLSLLRIDPAAGSIEVGYISFSPALQRTRAATEAIYLALKWSFEAGYRRFEWKCNALNVASRRAALRYGLSYEGVFRQAAIVKGRNRDTAWFAAIDKEWPALRAAFETWLDAGNFDALGRQKLALSALSAPIVAPSVAAEAASRPEPGRLGDEV
ncbi:MAG: GNAT family protein [Paracoccaceae bacterium]